MIKARKPPPRGRWQYGIGTMLLLMIPFSILAGALSGMLNPEGGGLHRGFFVVLAIIAPMGLMVALSLILAARKRFSARKHRPEQHRPEQHRPERPDDGEE